MMGVLWWKIGREAWSWKHEVGNAKLAA